MIIPTVEDGIPFNAYKLRNKGRIVKTTDMSRIFSQKSSSVGTAR